MDITYVADELYDVISSGRVDPDEVTRQTVSIAVEAMKYAGADATLQARAGVTAANAIIERGMDLETARAATLYLMYFGESDHDAKVSGVTAMVERAACITDIAIDDIITLCKVFFDVVKEDDFRRDLMEMRQVAIDKGYAR